MGWSRSTEAIRDAFLSGRAGIMGPFWIRHTGHGSPAAVSSQRGAPFSSQRAYDPLRPIPWAGYAWGRLSQLHAVFEALMRRFCQQAGLDFQTWVDIVEGRRAAPEFGAALFEQELGLPRGTIARAAATPPALRAPAPSPATQVATAPKIRHNSPSMTRQEHFGRIGRSRRKPRTPETAKIFDWMDSLKPKLSTEGLAAKVSTLVGRTVSRSTMQHYIAGYQKVQGGCDACGEKGVRPNGAKCSTCEGTGSISTDRPCHVPVDVRTAVAKLSGGAIPVNGWPFLRDD